MKGVLGMERLSLSVSEEAPWRRPGGELLHCGSWKLCLERIWIRHLSIGTPVEPRGTWNLEGSHTMGTLKDEGGL